VVYKNVPRGEDYSGYFIDTDETGKVTAITTESLGWSKYFADCFIADRDFMLDFIQWFSAVDYMDMFQIIRDHLDTIDIGTFEFKGYLGKVNSAAGFLKVNQDMCDYDIRNEVFCNPERLIYTKIQDEAPALFTPDADVRNSVISTGCKIEGRVENSIIFRSCHVAKGAVVRNSVIMMHGIIGEGVIDQGYSGEIVVKLYNLGDHDVTLPAGSKITQLCVMPVCYPTYSQVDEIKAGERGSNGFGSTDGVRL
jgi:ADP-glucose pyrophosphorylase